MKRLQQPPCRKKKPAGSLGKVRRRIEQIRASLHVHHFYELRLYIDAIHALHIMHRRIPSPEEHIRIHFLLPDNGAAPAWLPLYRSCLNDKRIEPVVVFLRENCAAALAGLHAFIHSSANERAANPEGAADPKGMIDIVAYRDYDPYVSRPHILVYSGAQNSMYQSYTRLRCAFVKKSGIRPVYIADPAAYPATMAQTSRAPHADVRLTWNQDVHLFAWRIFVPDRYLQACFYNCCMAGGAAVRVVQEEADRGQQLKASLTAALDAEAGVSQLSLARLQQKQLLK